MPFEIVPPGTRIGFVRRWRVCAAGSALTLVVCTAAIPLRGIQLGVDFAGGTQLVVRVDGTTADEGDVRGALHRVGATGASVVRVGSASDGLFQIQLLASHGTTPEVLVPHLEAELGRSVGSAVVEKVDFVGPRMGEDLTRSAFVSLGIALLLILVYVGFRFAPAYAPGAIVALAHDVLLTAGAFVLFGWEFNLDVVAALLTIVGYSLNDTIVIYDRIRENRARSPAADLAQVIDRSLNETLSRTVLTAGTTLAALVALLALGGPELRGFSAAMAIGVAVGTYSSVYVAAPLVLAIERLRTSPVARVRISRRRGSRGSAR